MNIFQWLAIGSFYSGIYLLISCLILRRQAVKRSSAPFVARSVVIPLPRVRRRLSRRPADAVGGKRHGIDGGLSGTRPQSCAKSGVAVAVGRQKDFTSQ